MEKAAERETHDFMNVESFSQLPFIRPAPAKGGVGAGGIRLFGKEFGSTTENSTTLSNTENESDSGETSNNAKMTRTNFEGVTTKGGNNSESSRKFECHYCCRNFPTSQALGGHQNAHKRERQHAKRAHLQSAMIHHGGLSEAHAAAAYGFMNYHHHHRLGGSAPTSPAAMAYQSWSSHHSNTTASNRFYGSSRGGDVGSGGHHQQQQQQQQPINGSPLGLWRFPPVHSPTTFLREHNLNPVKFFSSSDNGEMKPPITGSAPPKTLFGYEPKGATMQDHVSLDLRL